MGGAPSLHSGSSTLPTPPPCSSARGQTEIRPFHKPQFPEMKASSSPARTGGMKPSLWPKTRHTATLKCWLPLVPRAPPSDRTSRLRRRRNELGVCSTGAAVPGLRWRGCPARPVRVSPRSCAGAHGRSPLTGSMPREDGQGRPEPWLARVGAQTPEACPSEVGGPPEGSCGGRHREGAGQTV